MKRFTTLALALLLPAGVAARVTPAPAQQTTEGIKITTDAVEIDLGGRVQTQFNTTSVDGEPDAQWIMRRVRLETEVRVNPVVSGKLQADFAGERVSIKDAFLKLSFTPGFQLLAGKAYRPFSLLEQTSSTRILPIERGLRIRGVEGFDEYELVNDLGYSDRDVGLQLMGKPAGAPLGFAYAAGVFAGPVQGRVGSESPLQYAARATVQPLPDVRVGAGWSNRAFGLRQGTGASAPFDVERGNAFEADLEIGGFDPGFHLLSEVTMGDFEPFADADFFGAQAWLGYRTGRVSPILSTVEPILRVSYGDVSDGRVDAFGGTLFTPGVNVYFGGLNRVMLNYDIWSPDGEGETEGSLKAMFQLVF